MALSDILNSYRAHFPGDDRSDDVLVKYLGDLGRQRQDQSLEQDPEFGQRYAQINALTAPSPAENVARSAARGFLGTVGSIPKDIAIVGQAAARGLGFKAGEIPPEQLPLYQTGQAIENVVEPPPPEAQKSFLQGTLPAAAGSIAGFALGGLGGRAIAGGSRLAGALTAGALGAATTAPAGYEEAKAAGASQNDAYTAFLLNAGAGATYALPFGAILGNLDKQVGGTILQAMATGSKHAVEGAVQVAAQQAASNLIAQGIYDPKRQFTQGLGEGAAVGGLMGFTLSALASAVHATLRPAKPLEEYTGKITDERLRKTAEDAFQEIQTGVQQPIANPQQAVLHSLVKKSIETEIQKQAEEKGNQNATPSGIIPENNIIQREGTGGQLEEQGRNRNVAPVVQAPGDSSGRSDQPPEGGGQPTTTEIAPPTSPVVEPVLAPAPVVPPPPVVDPRAAVRQAAAAALVPDVLPVKAKPEAPKPVPAPEAPDISTTNVPLKKQIGGLKGPGGKEIAVTPAYFEVTDPTHNAALERDLVSQGTVGADLNPTGKKTVTHRMTYFEDQEDPNARVIGLPTYKQGGVVRVSGLPEGGSGTTLKEFMASGQYVPIASRRTDVALDATRLSDRVTYRDAKAMEEALGAPARRELQATARSMEAIEAANTEEQVATKTGRESVERMAPSDHEEELIKQFPEIVADFMPKVGKDLPPDLQLRDIESALTSAAQDKLARESVLHHFELAIEAAIETKALEGIKGQDKMRIAIIRRVAQRIYETYKKNAEAGKTKPSDLADALPSDYESAVKFLREPGGEAAAGLGGPGIRQRVGPTEASAESRYPTSAAAASKFGAVKSALQLSGADMNVYQARTDGIGDELLRRPGSGSYDAAKNLVNLVVSDSHNPNREDAIGAIHEAIHYLFPRETPEMQERLHRAVDKMGTPDLSRTTIPEGLTPEERARRVTEEALAEKIAQEGVDKTEARGFAAAIWRLFKEVYHKALMALQEAFLGPGHVRPELATRYMENRLAQFLARDNEVFSFLSILGGPKPNTAGEVRFFRPTEGGGWVDEFYNHETGELEYPTPLPEDSAAIRWRKGERLNDPVGTYYKEITPAGAVVDISAQNYIGDTVRGMIDEWTAKGHNPTKMAYDDIVANKKLVNLPEPPESVIQTINQELQTNGHPQMDPASRTDTLANSEATKTAATKIYPMLRKIQGWMETQRMDADEKLNKTGPNSLQNKLARSKQRLYDVVTRSHDSDFLLADMKSEIQDQLEGLKKDIRLMNTSSHQKGVLWQTIAQVDKELTADTATRFAHVIDKMATALAQDKIRFTDMMDQLAGLGLNWKAHGNTLRAEIMRVAAADPKFASLVADPDSASALASILVSYGKENAHVMAMRQIEKAKLGNDLITLRNGLKVAVSDVTEGINDARKIAQKLPRVAVATDRLLEQVQEVKDRHAGLKAEILSLEHFVEFHNDSRGVLNDRIVGLENLLGAQAELFETSHGQEFNDVPHPNATMDEVLATTKTLDLQNAVKGTADIRNVVDRQRKWLDKFPNDQRGSTWNYLDSQNKKLGMLDVEHKMLVMPKNVIMRLLGSWNDKMRLTGDYLLRKAAKRWESQNAEQGAHQNDVYNLGVKLDSAKGDARKAIDKNMRMEHFDLFYYDRAMKYLASRVDLFLGAKTEEEGYRRALPALRNYLEANPDTRAALQKPGVWDKLQKYYIQNAKNSDYFNKLNRSYGNKAKQDIGDKQSIYRDTVGYSWTHVARSPKLDRLYQIMRPLWAGTDGSIEPITKADAAVRYQQDPQAFRQSLAPRFTPEVWREFVEELARRPTSPFDGETRVNKNDIVPLATHENTVNAFEATPPGDIVTFAEKLYDLSGAKGDKALFVGDVLETLQGFYNDVHADQAESANAMANGKPVPRHIMLDERKADTYPAGWVEYLDFGRSASRYLLHDITNQYAYGRDLEGMRKDMKDGISSLQNKVKQLAAMDLEARRANPGAKESEITKIVKAQAEKVQPGYYTILKRAAMNVDLAQRMEKQFEAVISSQQKMPLDLKKWSELLSMFVGVTLTGPKTALTDTVSVFTGPLRMMGVSTTAIDQALYHGKGLAMHTMGGLFQALHLQWLQNADYVRNRVDAGYYESRGGLTLRQQVQSEMMRPTDAGPIMKPVIMAGRAVRAFLSSGLTGGQERAPFAAANPLSPFVWESKMSHFVTIEGVARTYEDLINLGVKRWTNPAFAAEANDPNFILRPKDLGYKKRLWGVLNDERAFMVLRDEMQKQGANLETVIRDVIARRAVDPRSPTLDRDTYRKLAAIATNRYTLDASSTTRPPSTFTDPLMATAMPLLGWSTSATNDLVKAIREPNGEASWNALKGGLLAFAAILPVGLAYAWMRDEYDEKITGKKSNVLGLDQGNVLLSVLDRTGNVGIFGLGGDLVNSWVNVSTQRQFTVDSRVFAVSSTLNALAALSTWMKQGDATYSTVYRPLAQALGGSGFLQYAQIINNALSLDNQESRITGRINVANYLRAAGRTLEMDVRSGRSTAQGGEMPSPVKPYVSNMVLAAYANNGADFEEARQQAIQAAKDAGRDEPEKYVARSFETYHPLRSVFRTSPSDQDYARILGTLDARGRDNVSTAVDLFNQYAVTLGLKPFAGKVEKEKSLPGMRLPTLTDFRRSIGLSLTPR